MRALLRPDALLHRCRSKCRSQNDRFHRWRRGSDRLLRCRKNSGPPLHCRSASTRRYACATVAQDCRARASMIECTWEFRHSVANPITVLQKENESHENRTAKFPTMSSSRPESAGPGNVRANDQQATPVWPSTRLARKSRRRLAAPCHAALVIPISGLDCPAAQLHPRFFSRKTSARPAPKSSGRRAAKGGGRERPAPSPHGLFWASIQSACRTPADLGCLREYSASFVCALGRVAVSEGR